MSLEVDQDDALARSERRFREFFDTVAVAIWVHDFRPLQSMLDDLRASGVSDMRRYVADNPAFVIEARRSVVITDVNATALELLEVPSKADFYKHLSELLPEADESFAKCIVAIDEKRSSFTSHAYVRARSGTLVPIIVALNFPEGTGLSGIIGCMTDVRERVQFDRELAQARNQLGQALRTASMGQLTASIAHEVNQPLSAVINNARAARRWLDREPPDLVEAFEALDGTVAAAERSLDVVGRVRRLLGGGEAEFAAVVVDDLVGDAARYA